MRTRLLLVAPLAALALTACGDDPADEAATPGSTTGSAESPSTSPAQSSPAGTPPADGRPAPDTCIDLPEAADGTYEVADAGTVVMTREGDRLTLVEVRPAQGWTTEAVEEEEQEIEVEFRQGDVELDFEAEIEDDGRLDVKTCTDDD